MFIGLLLSACAKQPSQNDPQTNFFDADQPEFNSGSLTLKMLSPKDGEVYESNVVEVKGNASPDAVISINDEITIADKEGKFQVTLILPPGLNLIEVLASNIQGDTISFSLMVETNASQ
jgi:hypothetical protein